ncbi:hypothetical protein DE146DRAFT_635556 [Phaeosphaeria sp. MPI-PUGE-AT-0046c]|nr:hypothetical protein DE146DRAFT_635556 [Phaeosphaeria sp. MPI-PUGE-AT-0046c]
MARSRRKDAASCTPKKHARATTSKKRKQVTQDQEAFGKDPWTSMSGQSDASAQECGFHSFAAVSTHNDSAAPSLRDQLMSHFGGPGQQDASKTTLEPAHRAMKEAGQDDIAIPTPIHESLPWKIIAPNGREEYCYRPISGFEHLFKAPEGPQKSYRSRRASDASQPASRHYQFEAPGISQGDAIPYKSIERELSQRDASSLRTQPNHVQEDCNVSNVSTLSRVRKRTRSNAQGLSQPSATSDKKPCISREIDGDDDEVTVVTESSRTFLISDIDGLQKFLRHRLAELTMKPVRGMVTRWVKQLEPKRKGGYGPYHKMLPKDAPKDATPPWWPQIVPYVEPAHLEKEVDMMFQHRDTPADELKRQQLWTSKLRRVAELEVTMTDPDQFSSSRHPAFSNAMKARAENEILPSLFDIMQSYEDFVNQYRLWTYPDLSKAPIGKSITWRPIPRPPTHINRYKRPRPALQRTPADVVKIELKEDSGEETEVDDTMVQLVTKNTDRITQLVTRITNQVIQQEAKDARRRARAETARAMSVHPVGAVSDAVATPPMATKQWPLPITPQSQSFEMEDAKPVTGVPFNDPFPQVGLQIQDRSLQTTADDSNSLRSIPEGTAVRAQFQAPQTRSDQATSQSEDNGIKGGSPMLPKFQTQMTRQTETFSNSPQQYQTILSSARDENVAMGGLNHFQGGGQRACHQDEHSYRALSGAESFASLGSSSFNGLTPSSFAAYPTPGFNDDFSDFTVFSQQCPVRGNQSYLPPSMAAQNMGYGCNHDLMYTSVDSSMSNLPPQANQAFDGLPYDFAEAQS